MKFIEQNPQHAEESREDRYFSRETHLIVDNASLQRRLPLQTLNLDLGQHVSVTLTCSTRASWRNRSARVHNSTRVHLIVQ